MAELTLDQLKVVRSWVGDAVHEATLHERYNRLGDLDGVILEELRHQHAVLMDSPTSFGAEGISVDFGTNMSSLNEKIDNFISIGGTGIDETPPPGGTTFAVSRITRKDYR